MPKNINFNFVQISGITNLFCSISSGKIFESEINKKAPIVNGTMIFRIESGEISFRKTTNRDPRTPEI